MRPPEEYCACVCQSPLVNTSTWNLPTAMQRGVELLTVKAALRVAPFPLSSGGRNSTKFMVGETVAHGLWAKNSPANPRKTTRPSAAKDFRIGPIQWPKSPGSHRKWKVPQTIGRLIDNAERGAFEERQRIPGSVFSFLRFQASRAASARRRFLPSTRSLRALIPRSSNARSGSSPKKTSASAFFTRAR